MKNLTIYFSTAEMSIHQIFKPQILRKFNQEMPVHDETNVSYHSLKIIFDKLIHFQFHNHFIVF
jgi:hypothetical protein